MRITRSMHVAGLMGVVVLAGTLRGEQPGLPGDRANGPTLPPDVRGYMDQLDHEQFIERQRASRALSDASVLGDELLAEILKTATLSQEQRVRLMSILKDRFNKSDRAAMGIRFNFAVDKPCISSLIDKFPAANEGVLRAGDVFLSCGGIELSNISPSGYGQQSELIGLISSYKPGDRVTMRIFRPTNPPPVPVQNVAIDRLIEDLGEGQELTVEVPMGRRSELQDRTERSEQRESRLRTGWKYYLTRQGISASGEPIEFNDPVVRTVPGGRAAIATNVMMTPGPMAADEHDGHGAFDPQAAQAMRRQFRANNIQIRIGDRNQIFASDGNRIRFGPEMSAPVIIPESAGTKEAGPPGAPDAVGTLMARVERVRLEIAQAENSAREAESPADRAAHEQTAVWLREELAAATAELDALMDRPTAGTIAE